MGEYAEDDFRDFDPELERNATGIGRRQKRHVDVDPWEIVRECPWSHAVDGDCAEYVTQYQMRAEYMGSWSLGDRCPDCGKWRAPAGVPATHDKFGNPIEHQPAE